MRAFSFRRPLLLLILGFACCAPAAAPAADPVAASSLEFAPADAAFYGAMLRCGEQYEAFVNSRAFARIQAMPYVQLAQALLEGQAADPSSPVAMFQAWRENEENAELLDLLGDMVSQEVFYWGDGRYADVLQIFAEISAVQQQAQIADLANLAQGGGLNVEGQQERQQSQLRAVMKVFQERLPRLDVPSTVIGFRITDRARAERQLARVEELLRTELEKQGEAKRLTRGKIDGHDALTVTLDGTLVPWDELKTEDSSIPQEELEPLFEALKKKTLVVSLALRDDALLLAFGATAKDIRLAPAKTPLIGRPEFAPLKKQPKRAYTSIGWINPDYAKVQTQAAKHQADYLRSIADAVVKGLSGDEEHPVPADVEAELKADADAFARWYEGVLPEPGAAMSFTFMTDAGFEGYDYSWAENPLRDGSQRLTLLEHVGGSPLAFAVGREAYKPEQYAAFARFVQRLHYYFEKLGLERLGETQRAEYVRYRDALLPLAERLHLATRDKLVPSLRDGQSAIVLDAKLTSRQWLPQLPAAEQDLPMLELALVFGVSDAELLKQAFREYAAIVQDVQNALHELEPEQVPKATLLSPTVVESKTGTIYHYPEALELGLDEQFSPNAGLSKNVAVLSLSIPHSERLLKSTPLATKDGPLSARTKPLAGAGHFDWAGILEAFVPWIDYGFEVGAQAAPEQQAQLPMIKGQVLQVVELLQCWRGRSSVTYREGDAWVKHRQSRWEDVAE